MVLIGKYLLVVIRREKLGGIDGCVCIITNVKGVCVGKKNAEEVRGVIVMYKVKKNWQLTLPVL